MQRIKPDHWTPLKRLWRWFILVTVAASGSNQAATFSANFNSGLPAGTKTYGNARIEAGVLKLASVSTNEEQGSFIVDPLDADKPVGNFTARFRLRMGGGTGGEGFSFNFAPDLPNAPFGENGAGSGLSVIFDTFDNGGSEAPAISIKYQGAILASRRITFQTGTNFADVAINVQSAGTIDVVYGPTVVHTNVFGYLPIPGRFGLGARTSEHTDDHFVDDFIITTSPLTKPYVGGVTPSGSGVRANMVLELLLRDYLTEVNPSSIQLAFNGQTVTPSVAKSSGVTTVSYVPPGLLAPGSTNRMKIVFADKSTPPALTTNLYEFVVENYAIIPPSFAVPLSSIVLTNIGFNVRTVQARANAGLETTIARAEAQLAGALIDPASRAPYVNEAKPGPNTDGTFDEEQTINYEQEGSPIGNFTEGERTIPGIPGKGGHTDSIAMEVLACLEIPAGYHRFGVNSDDGFKVTMARDVRDVFATVLGSFDGGRRSSDTIFSFLAQTNGYFPVRLVWFEGGGAANVEFFSVTSDGTKILINDRTKTNAIKAYRPTDAILKTPPYVRSASPKPGETGVGRKPVVTVVLQDAQSRVATNTIQLKLNNEPVTPIIAKTGDTTTVTFQTTNLLDGLTQNLLSLKYADNATPANIITREWGFTTARTAKPTGQWDFDAGNLNATLGVNLEFGDSPTGELVALTEFGTTTGFGIPDIGGKPAKVMKYNRPISPGPVHPGYLMKHGIGPNGGGLRVNQWTLVMDLFFPDPQEGGFSSLLETEDISSGGDLFVRWNSVAGPGTGGIGISGQYTGDGRTRMTIGKWQRIAIAVDLTATPPVISKFIDGVKFQDQGLTPPQLDGRFSLGPAGRLFSDDDNEVNTFYVNSVQILDGKLTDDEIAALGGPTAEGIPLPNKPPPPPEPTTGLALVRDGNQLKVSWPISLSGFVLESADNLQNPVWKLVPGVTNNSTTTQFKGPNQFFRLLQLPTLTLAKSGTELRVSWLTSSAGYTLETTDSLQNPTWKAVAGVTNNAVAIPIKGAGQFFRLRR